MIEAPPLGGSPQGNGALLLKMLSTLLSIAGPIDRNVLDVRETPRGLFSRWFRFYAVSP